MNDRRQALADRTDLAVRRQRNRAGRAAERRANARRDLNAITPAARNGDGKPRHMLGAGAANITRHDRELAERRARRRWLATHN